MTKQLTLPLMLMFGIALTMPSSAFDAKKLAQLSSDIFSNASSQHRTEVEPDTFAHGATEVGAFQVGRFYDGGSSDIGWATSTDGGATWHHGFLPGITRVQDPSAPYDRASDPSVAYDAKHGRWLIESLPLVSISSGPIGQIPVVSGSNDGLHWDKPVKVAPDNGDYMDKPWIVCDDTATSPYYGHCYIEWDDVYQGGAVMMSTSSNGGQAWSTPQFVGTYGLGGQPLAQPNGTVVVPYLDGGGNISAFSSKNGGATWGNDVQVASVNSHGVAGNMRTQQLPSAEVDKNGTLYVVWQDCSFRPGCSSNDIVMSTSSDGTRWSAVSRIPIDPTSSSVDHFIPGIAVDVTTEGSATHLGLTYYYFPNTNCGVSNCQLSVGYVGSKNAGATWTAPQRLTGAMNVQWLANTNQGYMVGDYISTSFTNGLAHGVFMVAGRNAGSAFRENAATTIAGLPALGGPVEFSSARERPIPGAHSDHPYRRLLTAN